MTYGEMMALVKKCEGRTLTTKTGKQFKVSVYLDCPYFTPLSTGVGRSDGKLAAQRFLDEFNRTGSLKPADYQGLTRNSSYFVALIQQ